MNTMERNKSTGTLRTMNGFYENQLSSNSHFNFNIMYATTAVRQQCIQLEKY